MTTPRVDLTRSAGSVEFEGVWVDDRRRCTWGLCDASFVAEPATVTALVAASGHGAPEAVLDLLSGRRLPVRGRILIDGVDLRERRRAGELGVLVTEHPLRSGEQALRVGPATIVVARPSPETLRQADAVVSFEAGFVESPAAWATAFHGVAAAAG